MSSLDPDFATMSVPTRLGVLALCLGGGAALGLIGTFTHQSLPPMGVAIALITIALYIVGLRVWGGVRTPAGAGSIGVGLVAGSLATITGDSVLVPANVVGYAWLGGIAFIAFLALGWPRIQRVPQRTRVTMEEPAFVQQEDRPLP
jgi:FtsH-binding integral membrane protein